MNNRAILDDDETFLLIIQLTDMASAAQGHCDEAGRDKALNEIGKLIKTMGPISK